MQAVTIAEHGGPEVLEAVATREPRTAAGEVVVQLRAAALNRRDTLIREGAGPAYRFDLPLILGSDGAGVRRDTGEEVVILPSLSWGDSEQVAGGAFEILGGPRDGTYAELVAVPAINLFPRPRGLSWAEAAALPVAALTAYRALFTVGDLRPGQRVVVLGVGSGVSLAAIQLARHQGAKVAVTSSNAEKLKRARAMGADVAIDYRDAEWPDHLARQLGDGANLVLDSVGSTWPDAIRVLRPGGAVVACGGTGGARVEVDVRALYLAQKRILGTKMGSPRDFRKLLELVKTGAVRPVVDSVRPLAEASQAHRHLESGAHFGKVVLAIG